MTRLAGKVAIITGAAGGLGTAMARRFAAEGASVLATDLDEEAGRTAAEAIAAEFGGAVTFRRLDVTDEESCAGAVTEAVERWGHLDVMVANAGIAAPGFIAQQEKSEWEGILAVNLTGVFLCAKHAFLAMQASERGGVILTTASVAGLQGTPWLGAYGASKAGVIQLTKTLALEGARFNIRANALCPVWTRTPMVEGFLDEAHGTPEEVLARITAQIPLGRLGAPDDVAAAALYLASDEAAFISGVAFPVDGAHMAGSL